MGCFYRTDMIKDGPRDAQQDLVHGNDGGRLVLVLFILFQSSWDISRHVTCYMFLLKDLMWTNITVESG